MERPGRVMTATEPSSRTHDHNMWETEALPSKVRVLSGAVLSIARRQGSPSLGTGNARAAQAQGMRTLLRMGQAEPREES